eukprot:1008188-Prorocentrum_minimum.AAC.1
MVCDCGTVGLCDCGTVELSRSETSAAATRQLRTGTVEEVRYAATAPEWSRRAAATLAGGGRPLMWRGAAGCRGPPARKGKGEANLLMARGCSKPPMSPMMPCAYSKPIG